jgi:hypothetical protein
MAKYLKNEKELQQFAALFRGSRLNPRQLIIPTGRGPPSPPPV